MAFVAYACTEKGHSSLKSNSMAIIYEVLTRNKSDLVGVTFYFMAYVVSYMPRVQHDIVIIRCVVSITAVSLTDLLIKAPVGLSEILLMA